MEVLKPFPARMLYQTGVVLLFLVVIGLLYVVAWAVISPIQSGIASAMAQFDVTNSTHANYELADAFMVNLWIYLLVICCLALLYWVYIYGQRRYGTGGFY